LNNTSKINFAGRQKQQPSALCIQTEATAGALALLGQSPHYNVHACLGDGFCGYRAAAKVTHNPVQIVTGWYLSTLKAKSPGIIAYKRRFGDNTTEGSSLRSIDLQSKRIAVFGSERWLSVSR
jgi:hypothetical protein